MIFFIREAVKKHLVVFLLCMQSVVIIGMENEKTSKKRKSAERDSRTNSIPLNRSAEIPIPKLKKQAHSPLEAVSPSLYWQNELSEKCDFSPSPNLYRR